VRRWCKCMQATILILACFVCVQVLIAEVAAMRTAVSLPASQLLRCSPSCPLVPTALRVRCPCLAAGADCGVDSNACR
jgi:hypothetical protein